MSVLAIGLVVAVSALASRGMRAPSTQASDQSSTLSYLPADLRPDLEPVTALVPLPAMYHVEDGDTLLSIALRFNSSAEAIRLASTIEDVHVLAIGQLLIVPPPQSSLQAVDPGLTVRELADGYGLDPDVLLAYNAWAVSTVDEPGGRSIAVLPPSGWVAPALLASNPRVEIEAPAEDAAVVVDSEASPEMTVYTIAEGDTLLGIALRLGVDPEALVAANRLSRPDLIVAGDALEIPLWARPAHGDAESSAPASVSPGVEVHQASVRPQTPIVYEVAPGDTITGLAERFGVDTETIVNTNRLANADRISVGDELTILPVSGVVYKVEAGDTLEGIAAAFRVDLGPIIDFNYLENADFITIGKELIIPGALPLAPRLQTSTTYVVQPGDTVSGIATRLRVSARDIVAANGLPSADRIAIGDQLRIVGGAAGSRGSQQTVTRNLPVPSGPSSTARLPAAGDGNIASLALQYSGSRYVYGGTTPSGFDCSGFVYYVYAKSGKGVSRGIWGQYNAGAHPSRSELQAGDIVFFQNTYMAGLSHNGIYVGNGQFIHASDERSGVKISSLSDSYWSSRWFGATRLA